MKDFDSWNTLKKEIDSKKHSPFINEREICYVNIGVNIGFEVNGKNDKFERPVIALKRLGRTFIGVPLTSQVKEGNFYFNFNFKKKVSSAILSQIRIFDTKRIERKIGYIEEKDFIDMKKRIQSLILQ